MAKRSAGILLYKMDGPELKVLLVHPGGPFWRKRDFGAWSVPKGEYEETEQAEIAARREFAEETGMLLRDALVPLGEVTQKGGKIVTCYAAKGDFDVTRLQSNDFEMEWPPNSGRMGAFPEVDRARWFMIEAAREKIVPAQAAFLDRLRETLA